WRGQQNVKWKDTTQPYWLHRTPTLGKFYIDKQFIGQPLNGQKPHVTFTFQIGREEIVVQRDISNRYVDPVRGEVYQPLAIQPRLTVAADQQTVLVPTGESEEIQLTFQNHDRQQKRYAVEVSGSPGWEVVPKRINLDFTAANTVDHSVKITPLGSAADKA